MVRWELRSDELFLAAGLVGVRTRVRDQANRGWINAVAVTGSRALEASPVVAASWPPQFPFVISRNFFYRRKLHRHGGRYVSRPGRAAPVTATAAAMFIRTRCERAPEGRA